MTECFENMAALDDLFGHYFRSPLDLTESGQDVQTMGYIGVRVHYQK